MYNIYVSYKNDIRFFIIYRLYMCKSTEICDETLKVLLKIFFEHTFGARFFSLFVVYIREIHGCKASIEWYTFSRTTSYFLRKWQKKLLNSVTFEGINIF